MSRQETATVRRAYYGLAEIADALGLERQLVTVWRKRRSRGIPEPDAELASGPIWRGQTVEPWIDTMRGKFGQDTDQPPMTAALATRACRRMLRLAVTLLEDRPRQRVLSQAMTEAREVTEAVNATAPGELGSAVRELLAPIAAAAAPGDRATEPDGLRRDVVAALAVLPRVLQLAETETRGSTVR